MWITNTLRAGTAFAFALALPAFAADLPSKSAAFAPAPSVYSWQGAYFGFFLGYGADISNANLAGIDLSNSPHGFTGGGRIGYDWQLGPGGLVFGLSTDISGANFSNSELGGLVAARTNWWGTTNVRGGITFANQLLYGTVGAAYGGKTANMGGFSASDTSFGWNGGVGIEGKWTPNISPFIEAKYVDLGSVSIPVIAGSQPFKFLVVQGGVNLRF